MTRTIQLLLSPEDLIEIAQALPGHNYKPVWEAIGYLTSWAPASYPIVRIYRDGNGPDLTAVYLKANCELDYVIGAVWHDDHYGFHS